MKKPKKSSEGRLWIRLVRGHQFTRDVIVPCNGGDPMPALREAMHELDLSMPVWLPRHQTDWDSFKLTRFTQDHFVDSVDFERMEVSYIPPEDERKPPKFTED